MSIKQRFIAEIINQFPNLSKETVEPLVAENLLSPFQIELPKHLAKEAQAYIKAAFQLRSLPEYLRFYESELAKLEIADPGNKSILMSYDFHISEDGGLKLIEINTNAAFLALGKIMYDTFKIDSQLLPIQFAELKEDILTELKLFKSDLGHPNISIIDENPSQQRLFVEFLVYNELFKRWGWSSEINDYKNPNPSANFIYNRYTDFFLKNESSKTLLKSFLEKRNCFSPNPFEYFLLADKQRQIDWQSDAFSSLRSKHPEIFQVLDKGTPAAMDLTLANSDEIWKTKKKWFIKPKRAYGSKQSYRGGSMSHKHFIDAIDKDFIAQEYIPAPTKTFDTPVGTQEFKYDLRVYAYQGEARGIVARLYQGQVTNLKAEYGGFACVKFV